MSQQRTPPRVTAQAPATASVPSKVSGSTPGSAPRYRVGLSKRSKVPSLLRSVKRS
ncbi:hypothetical protein SAICODRAFT_30882 [Saitoella complicata NRRL Y-17804]|nr:uncharacterized protein SAICODRAFT_30882 [Saitoella complicata NRRL Y-17804]ODQ52097.1 hypothetical protein SAICODRAFT_30882 [Saitoella complicata NRRL Y-17804]